MEPGSGFSCNSNEKNKTFFVEEKLQWRWGTNWTKSFSYVGVFFLLLFNVVSDPEQIFLIIYGGK